MLSPVATLWLQVLFLAPSSGPTSLVTSFTASTACALLEDTDPSVAPLEWWRLARTREQARCVPERQAKWDANAAGVLEFFSSLELLTEVTAAPPDGSRPAGAAYRSGRQVLPTAAKQLAQPGLAALGYAAGDAGSAVSASRSAWLAEAGLACPRKLRFTPLQHVVSTCMVTSRAVRDGVLAEAAAATGLHGLLAAGGSSLPVPTSAVADAADANWVAWPGRYCVARKCDGVRHLLIVAGDGTAYLRNRAGTLYVYAIEVPSTVTTPAVGTVGGDDTCSGAPTSAAAEPPSGLPPGTVLDGELFWLAGQGFFLAFDALALGKAAQQQTQQRVWQLPLKQRLQRMQAALGLQEAEGYAGLRAAARTAASAPRASPVKKQQAPGGAPRITLLFKQHLDMSGAALEQLQATRAACPYPTDGLVFTPCAPPYALGMAELLRKWQPADAIAADIAGSELGRLGPPAGASDSRGQDVAGSIKANTVIEPLVYECLPQLVPAVYSRSRWADSIQARPARVRWWCPVSVRWDKARGNSREGVARLAELVSHPVGHATLVAAVRVAQEAATASLQASPPQQPPHPARQLPFGELQGLVEAAVACGTVERSVDAATGLHVYNYRAGAPEGPAESICRGLVLHPASHTVVATPFLRFNEEDAHAAAAPLRPPMQPGPMQSAASSSSGSRCAGGISAAGASLASASFKVDGSLAIAFLWGGEVRVATRRRMDSEQVSPAGAWHVGRNRCLVHHTCGTCSLWALQAPIPAANWSLISACYCGMGAGRAGQGA